MALFLNEPILGEMVGNDQENSPNASLKIFRIVPKCPTQTHRCPNGLAWAVLRLVGSFVCVHPRP